MGPGDALTQRIKGAIKGNNDEKRNKDAAPTVPR
jgi:hypothetical protein